MTDFVPYNPGTLQTFSGGSAKNIVGSGTDFTVYSTWDEVYIAGVPYAYHVDVVTDATHMTLKEDYLGGAGTGRTYVWIPLSDMSRAIALDQRILKYITTAGSFYNSWTIASASGPSSLDFCEDTDNGGNRVRVTVPSALGADYSFTLPAANVAVHANAKALLEAADAAAQRTAMGLGTAATQNTGTSGANVPLLNGANTWSAFQTITGSGLNAGTFGPGVWINNLYSGLHGFALQQYQDSSGRLSIANPVSPFTAYLTINQAGNVGVGVGNSDPAAKFHVYSAANLTKLKVDGYGVSLGYGSEWRAGTDTAVPLLFQRADGTTVGSIGSSSTATAYNTSSDYRLKYDVVSLVEFALDIDTFDLLGDNLRRVMLLNPVRHKWLTDLDAPETHGFIAHEAQAIVPHAVTGEKDAVVDIGRAVIPARVTPARTLPFDEAAGGEPVELPAETIPEQVFENITEGEAPEGSTWTKTGERPIYQGIDTGKLVADLTAAVQELTLLVIDQRRRLDALEAAAE